VGAVCHPRLSKEYLGLFTRVRRPEREAPCSTIFRLVREIAKSYYLLRDVSIPILPSVCMEQLGSNWTDFRKI